MKILKTICHTGIFILLILSFTTSLNAQSSIFEYGNNKFLRLELNKVIFSEAEDVGFLTLSNYLNAQYPITENLALTAELPFSFANFDDESETDIGNIGVGLNYYSPGSRFKGELYVGIPTASENDATNFGVFGDPTERYSAFASSYVPVRLLGNFMNYPEAGFVYRLRGGFELIVATEEFLDTELLFNFSASAGYAFSWGMIQGGLSTISIITEEDLELSERVLESFVLNGEFKLGNLRPGIVFRIPLDKDYRDVVDLGIGLSLGVIL